MDKLTDRQPLRSCGSWIKAACSCRPLIVPAGPPGPQGGAGLYGEGGGGTRAGVDVQPRDRDPSDLARRAANASELISASPAEPPPGC